MPLRTVSSLLSPCLLTCLLTASATAADPIVTSFEAIPASNPFMARLGTLSATAQARAKAWILKHGPRQSQLGQFRVNRRGSVHIVCGKAPAKPAYMRAPAATAAAAPEGAPVVLGQVPAYHSKPGAARSLVLNFSGWTITNTDWNDYVDIDVLVAPPFSLDANLARFSDAEQTFIRRVWERVAEDFAPFDVDVTTDSSDWATKPQ